MAEGIMKRLFDQYGISDTVDSVGLVDWNVGNPPDLRAIEVAKDNGIDISRHRARQIHKSDFKKFDAIIVMDNQNEIAINKICPPADLRKIHKITSFDDTLSGEDIADPYHSDRKAFQETFNKLNHLCKLAFLELS